MAGLGELLADRAAAEADALAFVVEGGGELSYGSWEQRSNSLARGLSRRGVGAGDRVALCFENRHWVSYAIACAGVAKLGAVAVPLAAGRPSIDRAAVVDHCQAVAVLTPVDVSDLADGQPDAQLPVRRRADVMEISYRSGPLQPPRPTVHVEDEVHAGLGALQAHSILHASAVGSDPARMALWAPLAPAAPTVVTLGAFDPEDLCVSTAARQVDTWWLVPATALLVVESGALRRHDVSSLRRVELWGPQPPPWLMAHLTRAFGDRVTVNPTATGPVPKEREGPSPVIDHLGPGRGQATSVGGRDPGDPENGSTVVAPLAFSQEGMLWQEQFVPGSQNLPPLVRRFRGPLQIGVLEAVLDEIVRRHEPLRSRFELREGRAVQVVAEHRPLVLPVSDLVDLDPADQQAALAVALAHAGRPFDLVRGPLFEPTLFRLGPDDHVVVFRVHHSVYDDWSVSVFRRELSALYTALAAGQPSPLPDLAVGFAAFSRAQRRRLAGPAGAAQLSWWKNHLEGAPFCLQLPIDEPDRAEGAPQHSAQPVTVELPSELDARTRALARRQRATPFMTMLAAFEVLVHRYTGESDLLMASVVANRNRPELEPMIGCFTKKILLRQDMGGDPTFVEVLGRTRASVLGALPNQDLAFETVLQETVGAAAADHGLVPYVGVMFQGVTPQMDEVVLPGVATTGYDTSATTTRAHFAAGTDDDDAPPDHDLPWGGGLYAGTFLILSLVETSAAMSLVARGAFHGPAVERLLANFVTLLGEIVEHPDRRVSELGVLADDQQRRLSEFANTDGDGPVDHRCAHEVVQAQVARRPEALAVTDGVVELTYAGLWARAEEVAGRLRAGGVRRGWRVGICLEPSVPCVVAVLAVWMAGAAWVSLDLADDEDHLSFVVADASVGVVLTRADLADRLPTTLRLVDIDATQAGPAVTLAPPPDKAPDPGDEALVFYGSGTSSVDRRVIVEHRGVVNLAAGLGAGVYGPMPAGLRVCLSARPTDDAFVRQVTAVLAGHVLHVPGQGGWAPSELVALVAGDAVDVVDVAPEHFDALTRAGLHDALTTRPPAALTPVVVVGARGPLDRALWRRL
ncbi:MAG: condensation domain-containing protein, partial [Actinomycetota bacterium]|nr:condensation domain-containing protein [Actinomycetota bacterium]